MMGIMETLALAADRPGAVEPGTRPAEPPPSFADRFGRITYSRRAHLEGARCQVADHATHPSNVETFIEGDFRKVLRKAPNRCCRWCVRQLKAETNP